MYMLCVCVCTMRAQSVGRFIRIGRGYTQQQQPLSGSQYVDNVYKCTRCPRASQHHKVDIIKHTVLLCNRVWKNITIITPVWIEIAV